MKNVFQVVIVFIVLIIIYFSNGCKKSSSPTEPIVKDTSGQVIVLKPNIYVYPIVKSILSVKLEFPLGGNVIESIPTYAEEWRVEVDPTGRIDNKYDYLFYESKNPDAYQYASGWIVNRDSLLIFFNTNLSESGFSEREIKDFTDYWVSRLISHPSYIIYPQYSNDIDKMIKLKISTVPDNILRLFYVIKGYDKNEIKLSVPTIPVFERKGFVVAEWGVVLK